MKFRRGVFGADNVAGNGEWRNIESHFRICVVTVLLIKHFQVESRVATAR